MGSVAERKDATEMEKFTGWLQGILPAQDALRSRFEQHQEIKAEEKRVVEAMTTVPFEHWLEPRE